MKQIKHNNILSLAACDY